MLVSWDTTRADALGCYGDVAHWERAAPRPWTPQPRTPVADALAHQGVRFQWALSHAPTTLNSHTSVLSGRDPHRHRVPRNGYPVPADVPLLAERFQAAGWDTIGVVGASVLERAMGLDRGFRIYDDAVGVRVRKRFEDPAERVVARALAALDARPDAAAPLLLFVHFFDAHSPWDTAPARVRSGLLAPDYTGVVDGGDHSIGFLVQGTRSGRVSPADHAQARAAYLAEVAYADEQLGALLEGLSARGHDERLVVLFGDHGETLDEIPARPYQHGFDVDLGNIHVPLILSGTGRYAHPPAVVSTPVSLSDVAPTVLALAGVAEGLGDGRDLSAFWLPSSDWDDRPHFAEATKPGSADPPERWNNLPMDRTVVSGDALLSVAPALSEPPELFRLAPGQPPLEDPERAAQLADALARWDAAAPPHRDVRLSAETAEGLRALGYLDDEEPAR